jgi:hypothetical protein
LGVGLGFGFFEFLGFGFGEKTQPKNPTKIWVPVTGHGTFPAKNERFTVI